MNQILAIRPVPKGSGNVRAGFDAELDNGVRLYDLKLTESTRGWRVYGLQHHGFAVITLPPLVADALADLALNAVADALTRPAA